MNVILSLTKIISGGQTGVDRAALFAEEVPVGSYRQRTRRNVLDGDGTLLFYIDELEGGTLATWRFVHLVNYAEPGRGRRGWGNSSLRLAKRRGNPENSTTSSLWIASPGLQ